MVKTTIAERTDPQTLVVWSCIRIGLGIGSMLGSAIQLVMPTYLRDDIEDSCFRKSLKTMLFSQY